MPLYSYQCTTCDAHFERVQSFDDRSTPACPNGHAATRRVFDPPTIIFKGAGFYSTDHRRAGKGKDRAQGA